MIRLCFCAYIPGFCHDVSTEEREHSLCSATVTVGDTTVAQTSGALDGKAQLD